MNHESDLESFIDGELKIVGQLRDASNQTFYCTDASDKEFVYKPAAGEAPLWDFPEGTLTGRELVAAAIDSMLGWSLIPTTKWIEQGPLGPGMIQEWIDESDESRPVNVFALDHIPEGWLGILSAQDAQGNPLVLAHENSETLRKVAAFDAVVNNADRKAGHIMGTANGHVWVIDHGVCFHHEDKLRTVLWGWVDQELGGDLVSGLITLRSTLGNWHESIDNFLLEHESVALRARLDRLIAEGKFPLPSQDWPAIPWPVF